MGLVLTKKPKNVTIIEGFPGFGLIGTIAVEFLLEHLKTEKIGIIEMEEIPAMIAIHQNKVIEPVSLHYNKDYNLVLIHAINIGNNASWKLATEIRELAELLTAREIISLEGVGSPTGENSKVYYYSTDDKLNNKRFGEGANPLMEGIVVGVTGALLAKHLPVPITALFSEAKSNLPDSKAAAEIIKVLDSYLDLKVDPKPLEKQAISFEKKLKDIMEKRGKAEDIEEKKRLDYMG